MQHTKIIIKKLSASLFGKEQGEGHSLSTNGSTSCSDDSSGCSDGQGIEQPACPIYQQAAGQPTPDSTTQLTKPPTVSATAGSPQVQHAPEAAALLPSAPPAPATQQPQQQQQHPQQQQRSVAPASGTGRNSFFFARVPPTITHEQLVELFSKYGTVEDLNLFRPFAEAKTSKGCGIVRFSTAAAAATAKSVLHGKHKWTEDAPPMVVEWVNEDKMRSTCCKAGSNEIVFEPKSKTARAKQQSQSSTVHSSNNSTCSNQQLGDLTLAHILSSGNGLAMDTGSSLGSDQVLLRQGIGRQSGTPPTSMQQLQMKQQQQQHMLRQQPPPPPPRPAAYGSSNSTSLQQQWQQLQQGAAAAAAAAAATAARVGMHASAQRSQHQHTNGLSDPLPKISAAVAAAAAAQQQQQQQDIVQAVMQAASNSAAQFAAQQQQQASYVPMMGYAQQQQQLQQQQQTMGLTAGLDSAAQQQLLMHSGSINASLSGFCLMDTSSISGLQQDCLQTNHPSLVVNAGGTHGPAADGALDCYSSYNGLLMHAHAHNNALSGSGAVLPQQQQQQQAYDSMAAAAAVAAAASRTPPSWRQISMSMDGTYGTAAAAAAAVSASGLARYGSATAESQQQLLQRQIMSTGRNVLSGGNNMSYNAPVSGSCLPNGPGAFRKQPWTQQQQQLGMHDEEGWMSGCGVGGYFDLQPSSSHNSGSFHAASTPGLSTAQPGRGSDAAAAAGLAASGGLSNLQAISDSCMLAANSDYAALNAARQQQLQQGMAARRSLAGSSTSAVESLRQQQQQLNMLASRPPSSALSGSCLPSSPHDNDAIAAAAAAAAVSGSCAIPDAGPADGAADGLGAQINAMHLASAGSNGCKPAAGDGASGRVSIPVASGTAVVQALAMHLDSITNLSGAEVQIRSDTGTVMVWLTGSNEQVAMANNIVNLLLSPQQ